MKEHLGHYKALLTPPPSSMDTEEAKEFKRKQTAIIDLYVNVINYCVKYGYVLERWKEVCNMMIFKEPGNIKIHRLRIIHLYEADLSLTWCESKDSASRTIQLTSWT